MTAISRNSDHSSDDLQWWHAHLQDYVDGTLGKKAGLRFFIMAQRNAELKTELDEFRLFTASLDAMPLETPSPDFDAKIMAEIPLEKYETAPRKALPVIEIGASEPSFLLNIISPFGRLARVIAVSYFVFLLVSNSILKESFAQVALNLQDSLSSAASRVEGVFLLSSLVSAAAWSWEAVLDISSALSALLGAGFVTVLLGSLPAIAILAILATYRRKEAARQSKH